MQKFETEVFIFLLIVLAGEDLRVCLLERNGEL